MNELKSMMTGNHQRTLIHLNITSS